MSELAQHLRTTPSSLQRELASLVAGGLLQQRREGTRNYFKAETRSPLFPELRRLFEKTNGLIPVLQHALKPFAQKIACAFVYGSVARDKETPLSDIDLMVIGAIGLADLSPALRKTEDRLGREINTTSYSIGEFRSKVAAGNPFLSEVVRGTKIFVRGSQDDLEQIIGRQGRRKT